ncbi:hypothetical protein FACS189485_06620 [Spirochaetia bacterium]|nr:hypothetical protein FACS189485_06620 [Spirochaetia bacterium]
MKRSKEEYEKLINNSPLFTIDKDKEGELYAAEERRFLTDLAEYLSLYIFTQDTFAEIGLEIIETAKSCIKAFNSGHGKFLHYFDNLYGEGKRSALELAQIGQIAENTYFGKPCGLMDQTACASGGAVAIDFEDAAHPKVKQINFDLAAAGYALCVVDTRGSHADLTEDYAAIPAEMKAVAAFFGKTVLREVNPKDVLTHAPEIRKATGDRALLRAIHFFNENRRVDAMLAALERADKAQEKKARLEAVFDFLGLVKQSGDSSWELLQNIYAPKHPEAQGISLALAISRDFIEKGTTNIHGGAAPILGACRVHGGGFAGTIQAYIPLDCLDAYKARMEAVFGSGAVTPIRIRPVGAAELNF